MKQEEMIAIINEGTALRGWIANSFAQVEFLLGDLIVRCREFPEYADFTQTISHSAAKRIGKVRSMLNIGGRLAPYAEDLTAMLDTFEGNQGIRNLLAHGFCTFLHTPHDDAGLYFQKFERGDGEAGQVTDVLDHKTFRLIDLRYHKAQMAKQTDDAIILFAKIHADFGWGDTDITMLIDVIEPNGA